MRKSLFYFFVIVIVGCTNEKPKIGFMLPNLNSKRYIIERDEFISKVKENGGEVQFANADNDENEQIKQFNDIINSGVKVVVLDPVNRFTAAEMVRKAHDNKIKIISYDRLIVGCSPDAFISFDSKNIGRQLAEYCLGKKQSGEYVIFNGDKSDINAIWLHDGVFEVLQPKISNGSIKVVFDIYIENWNELEAAFVMNKFLKYNINPPDVVISASDNMSRGCINALLKNAIDPKKIIITGQNAEPFACRTILRGNQSVSIYKPVKKMASLAVDIAIKMYRNQPVDDILKIKVNNGVVDIPSLFLDAILVDSTNIKTVLMSDGIITEEDLKENL